MYIISSTVSPTGGPWDSDRMAKGSVAQKRLGTTGLNYLSLKFDIKMYTYSTPWMFASF